MDLPPVPLCLVKSPPEKFEYLFKNCLILFKQKNVTLTHEVGNDTVEGAALVAEALLAGAQGAEVLGGFGDNVAAQLHDNATDRLAVGGDVEEHSGKTHCFYLFIFL